MHEWTVIFGAGALLGGLVFGALGFLAGHVLGSRRAWLEAAARLGARR